MKIPRETIYAALWAKVSAAIINTTKDVTIAVTVTIAPWVADNGVAGYTKVSGTPGIGQYAVANGVYTFNAANVGSAATISYGYNFITTGRRLRHWDDVAPAAQPALFMIEGQQTVQQVKGLPPTWNFKIDLFIYDNCGGDASAIPGQRINALLDAIDDALKPVNDYQTLDGLVSHCWMASPVEIYEGYSGMMDQSVAIIPVEIRVPDASGPL